MLARLESWKAENGSVESAQHRCNIGQISDGTTAQKQTPIEHIVARAAEEPALPTAATLALLPAAPTLTASGADSNITQNLQNQRPTIQDVILVELEARVSNLKSQPAAAQLATAKNTSDGRKSKETIVRAGGKGKSDAFAAVHDKQVTPPLSGTCMFFAKPSYSCSLRGCMALIIITRPCPVVIQPQQVLRRLSPL
jgi:hypothetical protein